MTKEPTRDPTGGARRRYLAVVFSDLSDSSRLAAQMEAEDYADLLAGFRRVAEEIIGKHGGTMLRMQGDGILACFGYPDAREDDGRRATEAALDLHDRVRRLRPDAPLPELGSLSVHTGIHSGLVLLEEGDVITGRMIVIGNAVNVAARLSDRAKSDEILISKETLGAESHFFQTDSEQVLRLQGIEAPIEVCRIIGRSSVSTRFEARVRRGLTPFVGRSAKLELLMTSLGDIIAGQPRYLALAAPAGLGKTRLAEEFLSRAAARNVDILRGYCESYLSAEPAQPFLQMLRSLCGLSYGMQASLAAEALEQALLKIDAALLSCRSALLRALSLGVPGRDAGGSDQKGSEGTVAAAICRLVDALAERKPLVIFIDDWQWADDATRQILGAIRGLDRRGILVLVATRESANGNVGMGDARVLELAPLHENEAEQAIAHLLPGLNEFARSEIRAYAGGNPLFVEELCHSAVRAQAEHGSARAHGGQAWLNMLIEARVQRLPPAEFELARTAAVIGNVIPLRVLERLTGCHANHPLVHALTEQDLIYPGEQRGTLRFKHAIVRDVIYEAVGSRERRALHLRIAETLRQQMSSGFEEVLYEPLAYHYGASGQAKDAAYYAELAGDKAMAASALDRAQLQYLAALNSLDLTEPSDSRYQRWMQIAQRLALACVFDPSREQLGVLLRAVGLAASRDDQQARTRAEYWVGYIYYALGESGRAIYYLEVAQDRARSVGDEPLVRQIRATLGQACAAASDYERSLGLLDEAIVERRRRQRSNRPAVGFAYTLACKASVLGERGRFDEASQCFDEALTAVRGAGHEVEGSILCWRSGVLLWQGRWDDARRCALEAQSVAERVKSLYLYAMSLSLGAYADWKLQATPAALQTIVDATSWLQQRKRGLFISLNYGWLAEGMVDSKSWQAARRYAAHAVVRGRMHDRIGAGMAYRAMARASAAGHNRQPAEHYLARAMANAAARGSPHEIALTQLCDAEIRLARGQSDQAAALLDQAASAFDAMAMTWHLEVTRRLQQVAS